MQAGGYQIPFYVMGGLCILFIIPTLLLLKSNYSKLYICVGWGGGIHVRTVILSNISCNVLHFLHMQVKAVSY